MINYSVQIKLSITDNYLSTHKMPWFTWVYLSKSICDYLPGIWYYNKTNKQLLVFASVLLSVVGVSVCGM